MGNIWAKGVASDGQKEEVADVRKRAGSEAWHTHGGPGKDDYQRRGGKIHGEAKRYKRPMTKSQVQRETGKGRNELVNEGGFTQSAKEYASRYKHVKLIKPRKQKPEPGLFDFFR